MVQVSMASLDKQIQASSPPMLIILRESGEGVSGQQETGLYMPLLSNLEIFVYISFWLRGLSSVPYPYTMLLNVT